MKPCYEDENKIYRYVLWLAGKGITRRLNL